MRLRLAAFVVLGALAATGSAGAVSDTYGGATFHPFAMPGDTGCVRWVDPVEGTTYNCDPINMIFPNQSVTTVRSRLVARGWTTFGFGSNQYLHFATPTRVRQSLQLWRADGSGRQYHIRLWQTGTTTLGGVHHESGFFSHTIDKSWEASEAFVRSQLCTTACSAAFLTQQRAMQNPVSGTLWRGWANDGYASVIR